MEYIKIKVVDGFSKEDVKIPEKPTSKRDFAFDIYAASDPEVITSDEDGTPLVLKYHTGLSFQIASDYDESYGIIPCISIRPRSSIFKTGLSLCNSVGTVDEPYRGEVCLFFYNIIPQLPKYKKGERIAQIYLSVTGDAEFEFVDELDETVRGDGGFGHSGNN